MHGAHETREEAVDGHVTNGHSGQVDVEELGHVGQPGQVTIGQSGQVIVGIVEQLPVRNIHVFAIFLIKFCLTL